jgi:hypothetical protein
MARWNLTAEERFWAKVSVGSQEECWLCSGCLHDGYPSFYHDGLADRAHRYSWLIHKGAIPTGMCVLHSCDNRRCVNPNHLWLGTRKENNEDRTQKGRTAHNCGASHGRAKLTGSLVQQIRNDYQYASLSSLGRQFGVSATQIQRIVTGKQWLNGCLKH